MQGCLGTLGERSLCRGRNCVELGQFLKDSEAFTGWASGTQVSGYQAAASGLGKVACLPMDSEARESPGDPLCHWLQVHATGKAL